MSEWRIYQGVGEPHDGIDRLPAPPPWRDFGDETDPVVPFDRTPTAQGRLRLPKAAAYQADDSTIEAVNTALYVRRPLLVTGDPGVGKSTLADAVASELKLGSVLRWPVNSKTTLRDGLYRYDSLGRLEEAGLARNRAAGFAADRTNALAGNRTAATAQRLARQARPAKPRPTDLGRYVSLGPLGTALAPYALPRVLLIDEIDKSDIDLPNDLLDVFEEGGFEIPELARAADTHETVMIRPSGGGPDIRVHRGMVRCRAFPLVILTSNGEREFPPAFLRRCIRLHLPSLSEDEPRLRAIVRAHLPGADDQAEEIIRLFMERAATGELATDQLLNAVYLMSRTVQGGAPDPGGIARLVLQHLNVTAPAE
ncbi:AAA family ATPase [Streptomyces mangrovisoli]|uniref:AAA family ATPase n=1 Tax=Streptomyces mangrovisoli TaxID=1428628 RepID=A0A1J4NR20_9ACTN|nr:MoxR family ATPase [Streptomyces mangrovisoli]OIJ63598.1 AAA family ATPase [Streptomyces mangrovisoli]